MQIIAFYFEYLTQEKYADKSVSFCPGSLTFLLLHSGERCSNDLSPVVLAYVLSQGLTQNTLLADPADLPPIIAPLKVSMKSALHKPYMLATDAE